MSEVVAPAAESTVQPWQRPWWWCLPGEQMTLVWVVFLHVAAVTGIILTAFQVIPLPSWHVLALAGGLLFMGGLGTTVAYHRALTHRGLQLNTWVEQILIGFAVLNGSGNPRTWVAMHRLHHATSDRPDDISSPHQGGFWWSHLRWLWQSDQQRSVRLAKDMDQPRYAWWGKVQIPLLALSAFGGLLAAPWGAEAVTAALWIGPLRLLWALHAQCTINSVCHLGAIADEHGSGRNVRWLTLVHMFQGENWHSNHHRRQSDPRIGYGIQPDIGWLTILGLRLVGLARRIRDPGRFRGGADGADSAN